MDLNRLSETLVHRTPLRHRATRKRLVRTRRRLFEGLGSDHYSRPGNYGLDAKLREHLGSAPGVFVEAGANDGFTQSNTYYLERFGGWRGVLVEGIPELARECEMQRPHSQVFSCALVEPAADGDLVPMLYGDVVSLVEGSQGSREADEGHLDLYRDIAPTYRVEVPGRTLSSLLDEAGVGEIDFLSLDVEGYELQALRGLDLDRHAPRLMLVEAMDDERDAAIQELLGDRYARVARLTRDDVLYRRI
jgi:FkbM family methyltransferase